MSLNSLADKIATAAEAEAEALITEAKSEAKDIKATAKSEAKEIVTGLTSAAEREASQLSTEMSAAARQHNQKQILIAKREELDSTWDTVLNEVGSAAMKGRGALLNALVDSASKQSAGMILRPVALDRKVIEKAASAFTIGADIEGLGGFILETEDGSVSLDYRFESRLEDAWTKNLGTVSETLFS